MGDTSESLHHHTRLKVAPGPMIGFVSKAYGVSRISPRILRHCGPHGLSGDPEKVRRAHCARLFLESTMYLDAWG